MAIVNDKKAEPTETFTVTITTASGAPIAHGTGIVTIVDNDGALTATAAAPAGSAVQPLTQEALDAAVAAAKADWLAAQPSADFTGITVAVGDLPDLQLGSTLGKAIVIDATAAGWGWGTAAWIFSRSSCTSSGTPSDSTTTPAT